MGMTILLADDHALFRDGMRYVLQQLADQVEILDAENFSAALKLANEHPKLDLALMDLNMPESDGALSVRAFHLKHPAVPVVVVSGSVSSLGRAAEHGFVRAVLAKPFRPEDLVGVARGLVPHAFAQPTGDTTRTDPPPRDPGAASSI